MPEQQAKMLQFYIDGLITIISEMRMQRQLLPVPNYTLPDARPGGVEGAGSALITHIGQVLTYTRVLFSPSPLLLPPFPSPHAVFVYGNKPYGVAVAFYDHPEHRKLWCQVAATARS